MDRMVKVKETGFGLVAVGTWVDRRGVGVWSVLGGGGGREG